MTALAEKLKCELSQLPIEDRAELATFLIESLDEGADPGAEAAWDAELARRAEEIRTGKAVAVPAEMVSADLRRKFS